VQESIFLADGFSLERIHSDHRIYTRPGAFRPVVIPMWREVPLTVITKNMRSALMARERYFELLAKV
jgi:hypothetical protein